MTLRRILERNFPSDKIFEIKGDIEFKKFNNMLPSRRERLNLVYGHVPFGIHQLMETKKTKYFTFMRDPLSRTISFYYYVLQTANHPVGLKIKEKSMDLESYLLSTDITPEVDNFQVRLLNNTTHQRFENIEYVDPCNQEMLDTAKKRLDELFCLVGITERFDESLIMLKNKINLSFPIYSKTNISLNRPSKLLLSQDAIVKFKNKNKYDYELYKYAIEKFHKELSKQGLSFHAQVLILKGLCRSYAILKKIYKSFKLSKRIKNS